MTNNYSGCPLSKLHDSLDKSERFSPVGIEQIFTKEGIKYFHCLDCDFVFSKPSSNANFQNAIEDFEPAYITYLKWSTADEENYATLLRLIQKSHPIKEKKILDIGSGSGKFVRFLRRNNIEAYGIEPSWALYSAFLQKDPFFFPMSIKEYEENLVAGKCDVIFANDVIEHVNNPDQFFECIANIIESGGVLFISTCDLGSLVCRITGKRWHYFNKYHLSYFSEETITKLAERYGFQIMSISRPFRFKSVGYIFQYINDFIFAGKKINFFERFNKFYIPVNIYDYMFIAFKKQNKED